MNKCINKGMDFADHPHRCPVCGGNGQVPTGFYSTTTGVTIQSTTAPERCRTCSGQGMVWPQFVRGT